MIRQFLKMLSQHQEKIEFSELFSLPELSQFIISADSQLRSRDAELLIKQKKLEESIEAYKNALRQNTADQEARENLQNAILELKKKNPPKKDDKKQQQKSKVDFRIK